jgi:hypothetical protein
VARDPKVRKTSLKKENGQFKIFAQGFTHKKRIIRGADPVLLEILPLFCSKHKEGNNHGL